MAMKIKKGDNVIVIAGKDKGREGKVLAVDAKALRVTVEGINKVKKHSKPSQSAPEGGIIETEAPIALSNVMLSDKGTRVHVGFKTVDGKKVRVNKKTGKEI